MAILERASVLSSVYDYRSTVSVRDDFTVGTASGGQIGELGWGAAAGVTQAAPVAGHAGIINIATGTGAGTVSNVGLTASGARSWLASEMFDCFFICRLNTNDTDTQVRVGVTIGPAGDPSTDGAWFEKLYADTSWFGVNRSGGVQTRTAAIAAVTTNWVSFRVRRFDASTIGFTVDNGGEVTLATNNPTANVLPFVQIKNQTAVNKTIDFDYFECQVTNLSRA